MVEIMLVVVIIGMLAMLALPLINKARDNAIGARFINDLRNGVQSFELYALQTGFYPTPASPGVKPGDMEDELRRPQWEKTTPIGGQWHFDVDGGAYYAAVKVMSPTASATLLRTIDKRIDDGDLGTGQFQSDGSSVFYIIE